MSRVAIIFDNFGPYHIARLQAASSVCDLLAIEVMDRSATYAWENNPMAGKFQRVTLIKQGASNSPRKKLGRLLDDALNPFLPDAVFVPGWGSPAAWSAMDWCIKNRVPMVGMSESTAWDEPRVPWREWIKRKLVGHFSAALVGGALHRDYLVSLGFSQMNIFPGYDAIDNRYFATATDAVRNDPSWYDLPKDFFLASARFVAKKNLLRLIDAYAKYRSSATNPWSLILLGDGELRPELERQISALGLGTLVQLPGFKQYDDLPKYYARAGAFIHPSTVEPWGLVVNEAAASGLPLLVSNRCGCAPELVRDGVNGFTFDPLNVEELAQKLTQISAPDFPRTDFGRRSLEIVAPWGPERFAQGLSEATALAIKRGVTPNDYVSGFLLGLLLQR